MVGPTGCSGRVDRTLDLSVRSLADDHVSRFQRSLDLTGRSGKTDRTLDPQRPIISSKLPSMTGRVRSNAIGRSTSVRSLSSYCYTPCQRDRTQAGSVRCFWIQRPVT